MCIVAEQDYKRLCIQNPHIMHSQVVKLFKTLVRTDKYDFVTFWDFVTSYDWIAQALRIYNVPT